MLATGVERVYVYRKTGHRPAQHAGAGLLGEGLIPRPAFHTYATLIRQMHGVQAGPARRMVTEHTDTWIYAWHRQGTILLTAWNRGSGEIIAPGEGSVTDSFGREEPLRFGQTVTLDRFPRYILLSTPAPGWEPPAR